jgi:methylase of polypeptide subunit release factors
MAIRSDQNSIVEFGDFQTPKALAREVVNLLHLRGIAATTLVEPTCGRGAFVTAAAEVLPSIRTIIALDINRDHLDLLRADIANAGQAKKLDISLLHQNFFTTDWRALLAGAKDPILILGNPPWVTNAAIGMIDGDNVPKKTNFQGHRGIDAVTGKSNFDISEWMLLQYLEWLKDRRGWIAVLCKTAVARKVLAAVWRQHLAFRSASIHRIDAKRHFGVSVDACLFTIEAAPSVGTECDVFDSFELQKPSAVWATREGMLVSSAPDYDSLRSFRGVDASYIWRSGVKHDCAPVVELTITQSGLLNGLGELVEIEPDLIYPFYKSSDVAGDVLQTPRKMVIVPQTSVGVETESIASRFPKTWDYLTRHEEYFGKRKSSIYKGKPRFSYFGIGDYSFAPWKVAISGLYKKLQFTVLSPIGGVSPLVDDTVYFLPCSTREEADFLLDLLNSSDAKKFLSSMVFWDDKRPITAQLLRALNLRVLANSLGREAEYLAFVDKKAVRVSGKQPGSQQLSLGIADAQSKRYGSN